jgi:hypothetical protein
MRRLPKQRPAMRTDIRTRTLPISQKLTTLMSFSLFAVENEILNTPA